MNKINGVSWRRGKWRKVASDFDKASNSLSSGAKKLIFISSDFINGKLNFIEFMIVLAFLPIVLILIIFCLITDAYHNTERRVSTSEYLDNETFFYYLIPIALAILGILFSILTYFYKS